MGSVNEYLILFRWLLFVFHFFVCSRPLTRFLSSVPPQSPSPKINQPGIVAKQPLNWICSDKRVACVFNQSIDPQFPSLSLSLTRLFTDNNDNSTISNDCTHNTTDKALLRQFAFFSLLLRAGFSFTFDYLSISLIENTGSFCVCVTQFNAHCVCVKNSVDVCVTPRATHRRFNVNEVKSSHQSIVLLIFFDLDCLYPRSRGRRYRATAVKTNRWTEHVFIAHWNDIVETLDHHNWQTATKRNGKKVRMTRFTDEWPIGISKQW